MGIGLMARLIRSPPSIRNKPLAVLLLALPCASASFRTRLELKQLLVSLGAVSDRGQFASSTESARAAEVVSRLEGYASDAASASALAGTWDLVYTDVEPFRVPVAAM
jgi:hypothetical protein